MSAKLKVGATEFKVDLKYVHEMCSPEGSKPNVEWFQKSTGFSHEAHHSTNKSSLSARLCTLFASTLTQPLVSFPNFPELHRYLRWPVRGSN